MPLNPESQHDDRLRARFSDFQATPDRDLFADIQQKMDTQKTATEQFDDAIQERLTDFTHTPADQVWDNIRPHLPLPLRLKRYLQEFSKIAAVLLVGTSVVFLGRFFNQTNTASLTNHNLSTDPALTQPANSDATTEDFVFNPAENVEEETEMSPLKRRRQQKQPINEADEFLALILGEDEFGDALDLNIIKESLRPVEDLSIDMMTASALQPLPKTKHSLISKSDDIELIIAIPLQVVEPHEVEGLLEMYEREKGK